jgi:hypothetical protein
MSLFEMGMVIIFFILIYIYKFNIKSSKNTKNKKKQSKEIKQKQFKYFQKYS